MSLVHIFRLQRLKPDQHGNRDKHAFKTMEEGYIYFNKNLKTLPSRRGGPARRQKNKLVELPNPDPNLTLAASPGMSFGPVSKILGLPSTSIHPDLQHLPLKDLVRLRLEKRRNPTYDSLEGFFKIRNSCHIVEEINNDFFCDCAQGISGHLCKHTMAITYERTDFPVDKRLNAFTFKRRPKGRPQGIGLSAARTRDQGPALESEDDTEPEGGEGEDPQPGGGRGGGAMPRGARGRGRGPRRARGRGGGARGRGAEHGGGRGRGARDRGGQLGGPSGEGVQLGGQEGSVVLPGHLWDSLPTIIGQVQVDGGVLALQIADGGTSQEEEEASQEEEEASQEEEEEARVNNHEWSADVLELELDL